MIEVKQPKKTNNDVVCPRCGGNAKLSKHTALLFTTFLFSTLFIIVGFILGLIIPFLFIAVVPMTFVWKWSGILAVILEVLGLSKITCKECGSTHYLGFKESRKMWKECKLK